MATYQPPAQIAKLSPGELFWPPLSGEELLRTPGAIYAAGDLSLLRASLRVSIVGARDASEFGCRRAAKLARLLVQQGAVVVSGLAKGIDHAAHTAAMQAGGRTIAVIGTPLERCYPAEHARLQEEIYRNHLLVSQFVPGARMHRSFFPARNRTMAMLSHASVIVEASDTSGSLSQAAEIQRLGRPLFIMRSVLENKSLTWPSSFLAHGAHVLENVGQILDTVRPHETERAAQRI